MNPSKNASKQKTIKIKLTDREKIIFDRLLLGPACKDELINLIKHDDITHRNASIKISEYLRNIRLVIEPFGWTVPKQINGNRYTKHQYQIITK